MTQLGKLRAGRLYNFSQTISWHPLFDAWVADWEIKFALRQGKDSSAHAFSQRVL